MLRQPGEPTLFSRPATRYSITNIWPLHPPKAFLFGKSQHYHEVGSLVRFVHDAPVK